MRQLPLKFETKALNKATMVKGLHDLDCLVCPCLKVRGGRRGIEFRCGHSALLVRVRIRGQLGVVPDWCPRKKAMLRDMEG
jgi:hypothetical protein